MRKRYRRILSFHVFFVLLNTLPRVLCFRRLHWPVAAKPPSIPPFVLQTGQQFLIHPFSAFVFFDAFPFFSKILDAGKLWAEWINSNRFENVGCPDRLLKRSTMLSPLKMKAKLAYKSPESRSSCVHYTMLLNQDITMQAIWTQALYSKIMFESKFR